MRGRFDDVATGCRTAWAAVAAAPGEWVPVDMAAFLGGSDRSAVARLELRASGDRLDMRVAYVGGALASAVGRRVIAVVPRLPDTVINAAVGETLSSLVDAPFLRDPKIVIQRMIEREDVRMIDIRCRCPSHAIAM